jgi:lipid-A-disaccharide synthase
LPGSRTQEVLHNLPWLLKAAGLVRSEVPHVRFAVAAFKPEHAELAHRMIADSALAKDERLEVCVKKAPELMQLAHCCMAVSGSVSLELLHHARPTVVLYWITRTAYFVQNFFRKVRYITLVNLLASDDIYRRPGRDDGGHDVEQVLFPEYLTCQDRSADIARHVVGWLTDRSKYERCVARLAELRERVGRQGASERGAAYILAALAEHQLPTHLAGATLKAA